MGETAAMLDALRRAGDPSADAIIVELARTQQIRTVSRTLRHLVDNDQPVPEELPPALARWLEQTAELPAWVDRDRFERGCRLVVEHGPQVCVVLATASLVYCGSRTRPDAVSPTRRTASWSSERSRRRGARRPTCAR